MKTFLKKYKTCIALFAVITLICGFIFVPYLIHDKAFMLGWDMRTEYSSNYENLRTMLHQSIQMKSLPFYSWANFLGNDYWSSKLFYFQDIFDYFFALFTNWPYYRVIMIQTYLKFLVAGFSFYAYARYNKYNESTSFLGALLFTFSAYLLQTMMHPFFASFIVFIPLYFLTVDRYLFEKKKFGFIFMVAFLFLNNYYLFYSVSLFTVLYFIYRYYQKNRFLKGFMKEALPLIGYYFIGTFMVGVILIPEALFVLSNERIGKTSSMWIYDSLLPYFNYLAAIFTPTSILANRNTAITPLYSYVSVHDSVMAVFLWAGSVTTLLFPQIFKRKEDRNLNLISFGVISLFALIPFLSSAMHGFSEPSFRWMECPTFLILIAILPFIENPSLIDKKLLKISVLVFSVLLMITTPLLAWSEGMDFSTIFNEYGLILVMIPFLVGCFYAMMSQKRKLLLALCIVELSFVSFYSFYGTPAFSQFDNTTVNSVSRVLGKKNELNNYLNTLDTHNAAEFYRIYVDPTSVYWDFSINLNLDFNIMGLMAYDSTYAPSTIEMEQISDITAYLDWTFDIRDVNLMNLLSTKYAIVTSEEQLPTSHYKKVGEFNSLFVYENEDYINLGKTYSKLITYDEFDDNTSVLKDTLIVKSEDKAAIERYLGDAESEFSDVQKAQNSLVASITTQNHGFTVLSVPYDAGWKVFVNGQQVDKYSVSGGLIGIPLESGYNYVEMYFVPQGFKAGLACTAVGMMLLMGVVLMDRKQKKPTFQLKD